MPIRETRGRITESIKSLQSHPSDYSELLWVVYVFLGGVVTALALRNFIDWLSPILEYLRENQLYLFQIPNAVLLFVFYGAVVFFVPIGFSFLFSRLYPENRIVPPLYIQIIAFLLLMFFVYNRIPDDFLVDYSLAFYVIVAGLYQDTLIVASLGRTGNRDDVIRHSFLIYADTKEVKQLITSKQFLERRDLKVVQNAEDCAIRLKSGKKLGRQLFLELREGTEQGVSILNIAAYDIRSYSLRHVDEESAIFDWASDKIAAFRDFFRRNSMLVEDDSESNADSLVSYVMEELEGTLTRLQRMTTRKRISLVVSFALVTVSVGLFVFGRIEIGVGILAIAVALITDVVLR